MRPKGARRCSMDAVINNNVASSNQKETKSKQREIFLDFFRAVCLLFVMIDHRSLLTVSIGVFVLTGFFIASGYTFKSNTGDFKAFFIKKVKRLLVPFWICSIVMGCVELIRAPIIGYGDASIIAPVGVTAVYGSFVNLPSIGSFGEFLAKAVAYNNKVPGILNLILPTDCHLWFLPALFSAEMVMFLIFKFRKNKWWFDITAIVILLLLAGIETIPNMPQLPYGLGRGFFAAALMLMGYRMKQANLFTSKMLKWQLILLALAIGPAVCSVIFKYDGRGLIRSIYGEPMFLGVFITYICGLSFAYIVMYLMYWLGKIPSNPVSSVLSFAGRNTMDVYLWHMLVYFVGDMFMIYVLKATATPNVFYVELFDNNHFVYRWLIVFIAYATVLGYVLLKNLIKTKINNRKTQLAN